MSELKPCPFCGADNGYVDVIPNPFSNDIYSRGHCIKCHAVGTFYMQSYLEGELRPSFEQMAQMATEQWNTRPIEDDLRKRIAELEMKIRHNALWQASEDAEERAHLEKLVPDLKKRIAELEEKQRWIPLIERMPDNWESVLTIDISKSTRGPATAFFNPETSLWEAHFGDLWVTHWMPLPEPPIVYGKVCEE